jgi:Ca2+-binding EF-hand superfamily protein
MIRCTIRIILGLLAVAAACGMQRSDAAAQGTGGADTAAVKVVRAVRQKVDLKIGQRYTVVTTTGRVVVGTLTKMDAKSITLKDAGGKSFVIPRKEIDEIRKIAPAASVAEKRLAELKKQQEKLRKALEARQRAILLQRGGTTRNQPADRDDADPKDPKETIVLLSPRGPIIAEFAIYADGKPFRMLREAIVDDLMDLAKPDVGKDGKNEPLTWEKALADPRFSFGRYSIVARNAGSRESLVRRYDLNGDGLLQREEVRRYIAQLGYGGAFVVRPNYTFQKQPDVKSVLDTNRDGVISAAELKAAPERLKTRDADDNDLLTANELGGGQPQQYAGAFGGSAGIRLPTTPRTVFQLGPSANLTALYHELVKHYGDEKKIVHGSAFRLDPKLFASLDLNKNGVLESGEMIGFHLAKPAMKLEIQIGETPRVVAGEMAKQLKLERAAAKPSELLSLSLPGWSLRIHATAGAGRRYDYTRTAASYITRYDANKNGYIEEKELKELGAVGRYPLQQFKLWDANGDGKVYADEIKKAYERTLAPQLSQVTLAERSQGPSLFAALDETGDGRISLREMRNAGRRLLELDRNRNGRIDADEMPSEISLTITRGVGGGYGTGQAYANRGGPTPATVRGPRWFYHMDKNGDGDVSLREFLGTKEQFKKLDANGDGFIELKEAEAVGTQSK